MSLMEKEQFIKGIGRRTRVLRLHLGLSEQEMAGRLKLNRRAFRSWEAGERRSTRGMTLVFMRIGEEFNVSLDWLATGKKGDLPPDDRPMTPEWKPLPGVTMQ